MQSRNNHKGDGIATEPPVIKAQSSAVQNGVANATSAYISKIIEIIKENKTRFIMTPLIILIMVPLTITATTKFSDAKNRLLYYNNMKETSLVMLRAGFRAKELSQLTSAVWSNSLLKKSNPETDEYTKSLGYFNSDFNQSLQALYHDPAVVTQLRSIRNARTIVDSDLKALQNPQEEFLECYLIIREMQDAYYVLADSAISPDGDLETYNATLSSASDKLESAYSQLEMKISK